MAVESQFYEVFKMIAPLFSAALGGGLAILGGWWADRRRQSMQKESDRSTEIVIYTGMLMVRNRIVQSLDKIDVDFVYDFEAVESVLGKLQATQRYSHRLVDRIPLRNRSLMVAFIEIGLSLDTMIIALEKVREANGSLYLLSFNESYQHLRDTITQFDLMSSRIPEFLNEDDLKRFDSRSDVSGTGSENGDVSRRE